MTAMHRRKYAKRRQLTISDIVYRTAGILFALTALSVCLLSGMSAKYRVSGNSGESARVASFGVIDLKVREHEPLLITDKDEAIEKDGVYKLNNASEIEGFKYSVVLPGVDISKDPFVRLECKPEVSLQLYIKVVETNIPDTVTYDVTGDWIKDTSKGSNIYKYKDIIDSEFKKDIYILKDNQVKVSEKYVGDGDFSLQFEAWVEQVV